MQLPTKSLAAALIILLFAVSTACSPQVNSPAAEPPMAPPTAAPVAQPTPVPAPEPITEPTRVQLSRTIVRFGPFPYDFTEGRACWWSNDQTLVVRPDRSKVMTITPSDKRLDTILDTIDAVVGGDRQVAFIRGNDLIIKSLHDGGERAWTIASSTGSELLTQWAKAGTEMLEWSPTGDYLIGAWSSYSQVNFTTDRLWVLDLQTGQFRSIAKDGLLFAVAGWSPDGRQAIVRQDFTGRKGAPRAYQWLLVDLSTGATRVLIPRRIDSLHYEFTWDDQHQVQVRPILPGPQGTRVLAYDPVKTLYEDRVGDDSTAMMTRLGFFTADRQELFGVDLLPALRQTGIALDELKDCFMQTSWSPDLKYLFIEGSGSTAAGRYRFFGALENGQTELGMQVKLIDEDVYQFLGWAGHRALIAMKNGMMIYDVAAQSTTKVMLGDTAWQARSTAQGILFVTGRKVGILRDDGSVHLLSQVTDGGRLTMAFSEDGRYLAILNAASGQATVELVEIAPPTIRLKPMQLPSGYRAVGAVGDTLILRNLGQKDTDSLVLYVNDQLGEEIAKQPSNTMSSFASDDRWFVWCEAKGEMQKKLTDPWKIWAWDSATGKVKQIAQEAALIDGVTLLGELGPRLRIADGRVVWTAWTKDAAPKVQLHLLDLKTDQHRILATAELSDPLGGYDIHSDLIAYGHGKDVVLISDNGTETIVSDEEVGEVLVTADGVVWQGRRLMFWHDALGTRELASGAANRWWYTSTDHYITWWEAPGNQLRLLYTPSGTEHVVIETGVNNGGFVFGRYVAWTERGEGNTAIGMIAKLP